MLYVVCLDCILVCVEDRLLWVLFILVRSFVFGFFLMFILLEVLFLVEVFSAYILRLFLYLLEEFVFRLCSI